MNEKKSWMEGWKEESRNAMTEKYGNDEDAPGEIKFTWINKP